jgi:hypothetical protein
LDTTSPGPAQPELRHEVAGGEPVGDAFALLWRQILVRDLVAVGIEHVLQFVAEREAPAGVRIALVDADAQLADGLALDEGTADVGVLDQPLPVRDAGGLGISDDSRRARLRHRDHQIRFRGKLAGERTPPSTRTECKRPEIMVSGRAR